MIFNVDLSSKKQKLNWTADIDFQFHIYFLDNFGQTSAYTLTFHLILK